MLSRISLYESSDDDDDDNKPLSTKFLRRSRVPIESKKTKQKKIYQKG